MIVLCTSSRPSIASTNALPLKSTARLAVAPVRGDRLGAARGRACRSSRKRETTKSA